MIKINIFVIAPDLDKMAVWLKLSIHDEKISPDEFIRLFNDNEKSYILRADNWASYHNTELSVESVSAKKLDGYDDGSLNVTVSINKINISGAAMALGVPVPIAVIAAHMGERGLSVSLNAVLKLNRKIISGEAIRQLKKRQMNADSVYGEFVFSHDKNTIKG